MDDRRSVVVALVAAIAWAGCGPGPATGEEWADAETETTGVDSLECDPGEEWAEACNACWCTAEGVAVCARERCDPPRPGSGDR